MKYFVILSFLISSICVAETLPKNSIYNVTSVWRDQNNKEIKLQEFAGQKIVIGMVYTKCPHACPLSISKIQEIEREVRKISSEKIKIVLASFDPKRDVPRHLKEYMKSRKLDESKWVFLSAPNDATARELSAVLGISYKELDDGEFSHSNVISLLDEQGVRIAKIESLTAEVEPIVKHFKK